MAVRKRETVANRSNLVRSDSRLDRGVIVRINAAGRERRSGGRPRFVFPIERLDRRHASLALIQSLRPDIVRRVSGTALTREAGSPKENIYARRSWRTQDGSRRNGSYGAGRRAAASSQQDVDCTGTKSDRRYTFVLTIHTKSSARVVTATDAEITMYPYVTQRIYVCGQPFNQSGNTYW